MIPREILVAAAAAFQTTPDAILGRASARNIGRARAAAVFALRESRQEVPLTFDRVGRHVGRSAKSVWYWWQRALRLRNTDPRFRLVSDALLVVAVSPPRATEAAA